MYFNSGNICCTVFIISDRRMVKQNYFIPKIEIIKMEEYLLNICRIILF